MDKCRLYRKAAVIFRQRLKTAAARATRVRSSARRVRHNNEPLRLALQALEKIKHEIKVSEIWGNQQNKIYYLVQNNLIDCQVKSLFLLFLDTSLVFENRIWFDTPLWMFARSFNLYADPRSTLFVSGQGHSSRPLAYGLRRHDFLLE